MPKAFINESNAKYQRLFKLYKQAYPDKRGDAVTDEVVKIWRDTLEKGKHEEKYRLFLARLERRVDKVSANKFIRTWTLTAASSSPRPRPFSLQ